MYPQFSKISRRVLTPLLFLVMFILSCAKPFPQNPAGSKTQKYNLRAISQIRSELENCNGDMEREAVLKGLLWIFDFVQDDKNFNFIACNYLAMLYEMSVINDDPAIKGILREVIVSEGTRGAGSMDTVFSKGYVENVVFIITLLDKMNAPVGKYIDYYNSLPKGYDGDQCRRDFYRAMAEHDYDKLTDVFNDYSHFRFAYSQGHAKLQRLPADYRNEFKTAIAPMPFIYTEKDPDGYHDQNFFVTHAVFAMTGYGEHQIEDTPFTRRLKKYLINNLPVVRKQSTTIDLLGEYVECMKIFGLDGMPEVRESIRYIISQQNPDGSWFKNRRKEDDPYDIFHSSWTSLTALHYNKKFK